jgi:alkanesulfonate monooxygenase
MTIHLHWFLPTTFDSRDIMPAGDNYRRPTIGYLTDVARAAERNGFEAMLVPTGTECEDAWLVTAALTQVTERIKFLVAFRPGFVLPTLAAQMAATYQKFSNGRLLLNVVTGGDQQEQAAYGDFLEKDVRYARTAEFLEVVRGAWAGRPYSFTGSHYRVERGGLVEPLTDPPQIFFGGASAAAEQVSARHADVQLMFGEPPFMAVERIARLRLLAAQLGRTITFGIRLHVITRDTAEAAWAETDRLLDAMPVELIERQQARMARSEAVGQKRISSLHNGTKTDREALQVYPNLWAGTGLLMGGGGMALVGSHHEVADRIREYHSIGIEHFILSGYPKLEEAYWFGEGVTPLLEQDRHPSPTSAGAHIAPRVDSDEFAHRVVVGR